MPDLTPDRWRQIDDLYHSARDRDPSERKAFLDGACGGDQNLRNQLEFMLAQDSGGGGQILDQPAAAVFSAEAAGPQVAVGDQMGPYKIEAMIGEGGMGQVFRAVDTRLGRKVAVKVTSAQFSSRFEREARAISSLNHPHICTLFDVGPNYLVMELVEGETLGHRLKQGALPLEMSLRYGIQISEALEEAHTKSITHRDLKPGNIMIAKNGVKVLDFGLAKLARPAGAPAEAPVASETLTASQEVMGTVAYMAPEQLEGKECSARSDIFSLGLVLYEMATGKRAFDGSSQAALIAEVMRCQLPPMESVPERFAHVIERCLAREPEDRWQSARDVKLELRWAAARAPASASVVEVIPPPKPRRGWLWLSAIAAISALLAAAIALLLTRGEPQPVNSLRISPFSFEAGGQTNPVWSPDGKAVAFAAHDKTTDPFQVYVRFLNSSVSTQLTRLEEGALPTDWTSTGKIVFQTIRTPAGLWSISPTGGEPEPLMAIPNPSLALSASISPDGSALAWVRRGDDKKLGLGISSPPGAPPKMYQPAPFEVSDPNASGRLKFSPDGKQILLTRQNFGKDGAFQAWLIPYPPNVSDPPHRIPNPWVQQASWMPDSRHLIIADDTPDGHRLFLRDTQTGRSQGIPIGGTTSQLFPAVSPDGSKLAFLSTTLPLDVISVDLSKLDPDKPDISAAAVRPEVATQVIESSAAWANREPAIVYMSGYFELWLHRPGQPDRPIVRQSDFPPGTLNFLGPALSPDGTRIIYSRSESIGLRLWISAVAGGSPVRLLKDEAARGTPGSWSPDGAWFVFRARVGNTWALKKVKTTGQAEPEALKENIALASPTVPIWSPNGDWILYHDNGFKLITPDGKATRAVANALVYAFSPDGKLLYGIRPVSGRVQIFSVPVTGGTEHFLGSLGLEYQPTSLFAPTLRVAFAPDGKSLTYGTGQATTRLWLAEGLTVPKLGLLERLGLR